MSYERVAWASEGMEVWFLGSEDGKTLVLGTVQIAAGNHVRVARNGETWGWRAIDDCFVPSGDPHGVGYVSEALRIQRRFNRSPIPKTRVELIPEHGLMDEETVEAAAQLTILKIAGKP